MIKYPKPSLAARNSPIITPTRANPMLTFMLLTMIGIEEGRITLNRVSCFVPPRV